VSDVPGRATWDGETLLRLQRLLLLTAMGGIVGMGLELLFIGPVEDRLQQVPVALLAAGLFVLAWQALRPDRTSVLAARLLMSLFVASGLVGVALHYRGNAEFAREMHPSIAGLELVTETLTGATPVLAPGSMALLGIVGLAAVYRISPGRTRRSGTTKEQAT
jgi:hypothetical protein